MVKVCILDYDSGNTKSVENIFEKLNIDYCLSNSKPISDIICIPTHIPSIGLDLFRTSSVKIFNGKFSLIFFITVE